MALSRTIGHLIILIVGVLASIAVTTDLRLHVVELVRHLRSGNWEVMTDRGTIEQIVRAKYSDSAAWAITFAAASGQSFPLTDARRRETVMLLGQQALAESPNLRFNSTPLPVSYGGFLGKALLELAIRPDAGNSDALRRLASEFARTSTGPRKTIDPAVYSQAQDYLAKLPKMDLLKKALSDYSEFGPSRGLAFAAFEVATSPSYDNPGAWDSHAQTLAQVGKCKAKVKSLSDEKELADANVALLPRILEVDLERPWFSDALVDSALEKRGPLTSEYFQLNGDLRVIPKRFWVLLPEDAWIEPVSDSDRSRIIGWGHDNTCCRVVCDGFTFVLSPTSFRQSKDSTYTARRSDLSPLLYAIVSRRRAAH
jgi:hypothetical protein